MGETTCVLVSRPSSLWCLRCVESDTDQIDGGMLSVMQESEGELHYAENRLFMTMPR